MVRIGTGGFVLELARQERAAALQLAEDVFPQPSLLLEELLRPAVPLEAAPRLARERPNQREIFDRVDEGVPLEQLPVIPQQPVELGRVVPAEPAPEHEPLRRCYDRDRVELEKAETPHGVQHPSGRPVKQLRTDSDPARLLDAHDLTRARHGEEVNLVPTQAEKAERFAGLHEGEPFVIPNPWDAGSARALAALGFDALATTSSGFAFTLGRGDGDVTLDEVVEDVRAIDAATGLPVSVDLENGYGPDPADAARAIERAAEAGAVGGSIEDYDRAGRLYDPAHAVERVTAAVEAARLLPFRFMLVARAENHIRDNPDLDDTIARLRAYEGAGADVLYAPGLRSVDEIRAVCDAVSRPVNVLAVAVLSLAEIFGAGAQRVSVGGSLTWVAVKAMADAAAAIRDHGDLSALAAKVPLDEWL